MKAQTILVPVDFSDVTVRVAEAACAIADAFHGRIILLHVEEPEPDFVGFEAGPQQVRVAVAETARESKKELEALQINLAAGGGKVSAYHIQGPVVEKILKQAKEHQADLIVIGSHGHGAFYNLLVGSVASGLLKDAKCPILVIPARKDA